jgi:hypothetical protein
MAWRKVRSHLKLEHDMCLSGRRSLPSIGAADEPILLLELTPELVEAAKPVNFSR